MAQPVTVGRCHSGALFGAWLRSADRCSYVCQGVIFGLSGGWSSAGLRQDSDEPLGVEGKLLLGQLSAPAVPDIVVVAGPTDRS
jgi:hypothetical protein